MRQTDQKYGVGVPRLTICPAMSGFVSPHLHRLSIWMNFVAMSEIGFKYQPKPRRRKAKSQDPEDVGLALAKEKDDAAEERRLLALERAQLEAKREELNVLAERISKEAMRQVAEQGLEIKSWADLERADKMGRRALGMGEDGAEKKVALNVMLLEGGAGLIDRTPPTIEG